MLVLSEKHKYFLFFTVIFGIYFYINVPLVLKSVFLADDLPIIFFSQKTPFTLFTYWENGLQELIPAAKFESFRYRPVTSFMFYLTYVIFDLKPMLWGFVSQLNHLINFALLIIILKKIQALFYNKNLLYLIVPVFYLFYPGNVTNLAWASGRIDLLVIFFCLSSFYFSLQYIQKKNFYFLIISSVFFLLGTLTKENALSWFIVEFLLLWQMYYLLNKPPQLFTSAVKLLNAKLTAGIIYVLLRTSFANISDKSAFANLKFLTGISAYLKSLFFTILPVDSGTFIYSLIEYDILSLSACVIYFSTLSLILIVFFPQKNWIAALLSGFGITLSTLSFYIITGGGTYRLFVLTFTTLLVYFFILMCGKSITKSIFNIRFKVAALIVLIFFIFGFNKISDYWIVNYNLQEVSLDSLLPLYDSRKENIILNYPHSLGQTYCYSDIGVYLFYKVNNRLGRFNNISELAAINSTSAINYIKGMDITEDNHSFVVSSPYNDTYFSPGAFFTEKSFAGEKYGNLKNYSFEVLKLNSFSKPLSIKLEPKQDADTSLNYIKFVNGKFEKL